MTKKQINNLLKADNLINELVAELSSKQAKKLIKLIDLINK